MVLAEALEVIIVQPLQRAQQELEVRVIHHLSVLLKERMVVMVLLVHQAQRAQLLQQEVEVLQLAVVKVQLQWRPAKEAVLFLRAPPTLTNQPTKGRPLLRPAVV